MAERFMLPWRIPVAGLNGGVFVSRGRGMHQTRVIDSHELIVVRRGVLGMFEDEDRFTVAPGEALLLSGGRRHGGTAPYPPELEFAWIHFRADSDADGPVARLPRHARVRRLDLLWELIRRFLDEQADGRLDAVRGGLLVMLMLAELDERLPAGTAPSAAEFLAERVDVWLRTHHEQAVSTRDVAEALGLNPDYLGRSYRRARGCTVLDVLHRERLRHARRLLLETGLSLERIARDSGFPDAAWFRRVFGRHHGMSPRAWRRLHGRGHVNTE